MAKASDYMLMIPEYTSMVQDYTWGDLTSL